MRRITHNHVCLKLVLLNNGWYLNIAFYSFICCPLLSLITPAPKLVSLNFGKLGVMRGIRREILGGLGVLGVISVVGRILIIGLDGLGGDWRTTSAQFL